MKTIDDLLEIILKDEPSLSLDAELDQLSRYTIQSTISKNILHQGWLDPKKVFKIPFKINGSITLSVVGMTHLPVSLELNISKSCTEFQVNIPLLADNNYV